MARCTDSQALLATRALDVIAFRALEPPRLAVCSMWLDTGEHHPSATVRAERALYRFERFHRFHCCREVG
jgi:hypothetical protein